MADDASEYLRQEQIWGGLYGPPNAARMIEEAKALRETQPDRPIREIFAEVEPNDDDDPDEAGAARPGVG